MITVYTAAYGSKYPLRDDQITDGASFKAYVDEPRFSEVWEQEPAYDRFKSDRRNSRVPKILAHQFIDTEYSIYLDNNLALKVPAQRLVDEWLDGYDIAVWKHPERDCIYDEAEICAQYNLDDPKILHAQAEKYKNDGYGKHRGLAECGTIVRRHTDKVEELNNAWFSEYSRHSVRDQISFMYAANRVGIRVNFISPSTRTGHPYVHFQNKGVSGEDMMNMKREI